MAAADLDGDGTLNYDEFIAATANLSKLEREANILSAFKQFDTDHSGALSKSEVMVALTSMGSTEQEIEVSGTKSPNLAAAVWRMLSRMTPYLWAHCHADCCPPGMPRVSRPLS